MFAVVCSVVQLQQQRQDRFVVREVLRTVVHTLPEAPHIQARPQRGIGTSTRASVRIRVHMNRSVCASLVSA